MKRTTTICPAIEQILDSRLPETRKSVKFESRDPSRRTSVLSRRREGAMIFHELNRANCKTYLIGCERTRKALLVDPIKERVDRYVAMLAYQGLRLEYVVDTHTHADHRTGAWDLRELAGARVVMHRRAPAPNVDVHLEDGNRLYVGEIGLTAIHTPGHTPDSMSLVAADRVFTGDTLMIRATGRADFAGGNPGEQYDSITRKLFALNDSTLVFPAHDYRGNTESTIGEEKRANPRIAGRTRDAYVELMNNLGLPLPVKIQEALQSNQSAIEDDSVKFPSFAQLNAVRQLAPKDVNERRADRDSVVHLDPTSRIAFPGDGARTAQEQARDRNLPGWSAEYHRGCNAQRAWLRAGLESRGRNARLERTKTAGRAVNDARTIDASLHPPSSARFGALPCPGPLYGFGASQPPQPRECPSARCPNPRGGSGGRGTLPLPDRRRGR